MPFTTRSNRIKTLSVPLLLPIFLFGCLSLPAKVVNPIREKVVACGSARWKWPSKERRRTDVPNEAKVIYRTPTSWSSTLWIDVGKEDTHSIVEVNSPVLSDDCLVGVVDRVGKRRSRVRLITDASLTISVQAVRGDRQKRHLLGLVNQFSLGVSLSEEELLEQEEREELYPALEQLRQLLRERVGSHHLAKGELFGTSAPLWRTRSPILRGVGFNYDFADEKGPAREIRSGKPYDCLFDGEEIALIKRGDLLVTTGMDGIFPADIPVAYVSHVETLQEGEPSYTIQARVCAPSLQELSAVTLLPAQRGGLCSEGKAVLPW